LEQSLLDRIHEKCLGCGACTFSARRATVSILQMKFLRREGSVVRNWDTCLFSSIPWKRRAITRGLRDAKRTRQRLMHKFNYFRRTFRRIACVGCGRCILYCPVIRYFAKRSERSTRNRNERFEDQFHSRDAKDGKARPS